MRFSCRAFFLVALLVWPLPTGASTPGDKDPGAIARPGQPTAAQQPDDAGIESAQENRDFTYVLDAQQEYRFRGATTPTLSEPSSDLDGLEPDPGEAETDHDVRLSLTSGVYENEERFSAQLSSALWADLDGTIPQGDPSALGSMYDTSSPHLWFDVYELWAEHRSDGTLAMARGGRQTAEHGLPATFDGAALQVRALGKYLNLFLFGGRTVHFFETDASLFEDWIGSTGAVIRPSRDWHLELDYRFSHEDTVAVRGLDDHSYGITAKYRTGDWFRAKGYVRGLNQFLSHTGTGLSLTATELELGINLGLDAQTATLSEVNESSDPYYAILGESKPNIRPQVEVWKDFSTKAGTYGIRGGWNARILVRDAPTAFNRDYGRFYWLAQASDIGIAGPFADLLVEYHYGPAGDDIASNGLLTLGGSIGYDAGGLRAETGTQYQRLKYEYFVDVGEREDVRTFFVGARYKLLAWLSARARYEYEVFDRDLHTFTFTMGQSY